MTDMTPAEAQETEATEEYGTATLSGVDLRIKPGNRWRPSYLRALREGDYDTWAAGVLHKDDVAVFIDLDPTFDEINVFTTAAMGSTGEAPGKSGGRTKSSTRTRKR
ncbi:hypothetical protein CP967_31125 [Streptomyces nitrosporeus]|uniref:Uncharacterized protein n=1 Tax=Streptomyces nitrosporeus TaxID=28894 RepID=A0A5J6FIL9_9ACTN|nr:hypothetical protein [Streptomyces nitrosporeus]QEU75826.1 hypothetical protein CP967_31125 [Streptomyces nitrosporeus]GGY88561.1 hypothetical protein GCM10010327_19100 [Streptomyces nitrosporeus]